MSKELRQYAVMTDNGMRYWSAEDCEHAIEQHNLAHSDQEGEGVLLVAESKFLQEFLDQNGEIA